MNPTLPRRFFAFTMAMTFLLLGAGDIFGVQPCPHHEVGGPGGEHGAGHGPESSEDSHDHGGSPAAPDADHAPCTCYGGCPSSAVAVLPIAATRSVEAETIQAAPVSFAAHQALLPRFTPYILPYAHAPPLIG